MKFIIHFELPDGSEDSILLRGDTVEEIRTKSATELAKRGGTSPWSEEVS